MVETSLVQEPGGGGGQENERSFDFLSGSPVAVVDDPPSPTPMPRSTSSFPFGKDHLLQETGADGAETAGDPGKASSSGMDLSDGVSPSLSTVDYAEELVILASQNKAGENKNGGTGALPKGRARVPYEKGYSQMDWLKLSKSSADLSGLNGAPRRRIKMEEVKMHRTEQDAWTVLRGKVYNIGPYLPFHPGGRDILLKVAGRNGTSLFDKYHRWVNFEFLLEKCFVGVLEPDPP